MFISKKKLDKMIQEAKDNKVFCTNNDCKFNTKNIIGLYGCSANICNITSDGRCLSFELKEELKAKKDFEDMNRMINDCSNTMKKIFDDISLLCYYGEKNER